MILPQKAHSWVEETWPLREARSTIHANPTAVFDYLDAPARFGMHMSRRSAMMFGGRMSVAADVHEGRAIGSIIRLSGAFAGIPISVAQIITDRTPPTRKVWETLPQARLLILEAYCMGFDIEGHGPGSSLRVWIKYRSTQRGFWALAASLFAGLYAQWCLDSIVKDVSRHFPGGRT
jgi:hypothetical protein